MRFLPPPFEKKWLLFSLWSAIAASILIVLARFVLSGQQFELIYMLRFMLLGTVISLVFSAMGFLGGIRLWYCSYAGFVIGLAVMVYFSRFSGNKGGWEELIGLLAFAQLLAAGVIVGILVEIIRAVYLKIKSKQ